MQRLLGVISLLMFSQLAFAASSVKVLSQHDIEVTHNKYLLALQKAEVPVHSNHEFEEALPGGFSRKGKEIQFSNPYFGWSLGECNRGERKDKPLTTRIWQDDQQRVWLEFSAVETAINKFGVIECGNEVDLVNKKLLEFSSAATE